MEQVQSLGLSEVAPAAALIARAFDEDPLNAHFYPDAADRARLAPSMFEAIVRYDVLYGQVDRLVDFTALAAWRVPVGSEETPEKLARAGFADLPGDVPLGAFDAVFAAIAAATEKVAPEPHWHLEVLAVDPACQGCGLGTVLLQHGLSRAHAGGHPVLLETFAPRTVPFYRRHGFEVIVDDVESTYGLRYWVLRHVPRVTPAGSSPHEVG
ncbi:MAG: GNAT family N-acetyltransferase [Acidimicrobiales bacterium]